MEYALNTAQQQAEMLAAIGIEDTEALFASVPAAVRLQKPLNLPPPLSEMELVAELRALAGKNTADAPCFLGAGVYDHFIPAALDALANRAEFVTAYTPYQPEISQGTLTAIFEYQTMICRLTGLDISNASLYDGATAVQEAAAMACAQTRRNTVLVAETVHPQARQVLCTAGRFQGMRVEVLACPRGVVDTDELSKRIHADTAAVVLQSPNFFGLIEDIAPVSELAHKAGALCIASCNPIALGLLESPGALGCDIAVGDGQTLGNAMAFGGPHLGFLAAKTALLRRMPGRIVGQTVDTQGRRSFVLTIQTREQHIRREKATSNICSNQALNALRAVIYLSLLGETGLRTVATLCAQKARYCRAQLLATGKFEPLFEGAYFHEFALGYQGDVEALNAALLREGLLGGYALAKTYPAHARGLLFAVTEKRTRSEIDALAEGVKRA